MIKVSPENNMKYLNRVTHIVTMVIFKYLVIEENGTFLFNQRVRLTVYYGTAFWPVNIKCYRRLKFYLFLFQFKLYLNFFLNFFFQTPGVTDDWPAASRM